jgi:phosphotransacetylase
MTNPKQNPRDSSRLEAIIERARNLPPLKTAVIDAGEVHVLEGMLEARDEGLIDPILIGQPSRIHQACLSTKCQRLDELEIIPAETDEEAAEKGVELVKLGKADALTKGWIHTDTLMYPVLKFLRTGKRISHVFVADLPNYSKLLFITDAAINIAPGLPEKAAIVQNAVDLARQLGVEQPKVAALSAVEIVKPAIASTIDAACLSKMAERGQIRHAIVDGPLAFDNTISLDAAHIKQINSPVSGDVDILLAPDINAANILAKDLEYLAGATMAGIVIGAQIPIMLPSRSDPPTHRPSSSSSYCHIATSLSKREQNQMSPRRSILTLNAGSSSLKFGIFGSDASALELFYQGVISDLDSTPHLRILNLDTGRLLDQKATLYGQEQTVNYLLRWIDQHIAKTQLVAVGHRVVHGGSECSEPMLVDQEDLNYLQSLIPLAPLHLPHNLAAIHTMLQNARICRKWPVSILPFIAVWAGTNGPTPCRINGMSVACDVTVFTACPMSTSLASCQHIPKLTPILA